MVFTLGALKNFANFTGKIHVLESLLKKFQVLRPANLSKRDFNTVFSCDSSKIFKSSFLQNTSGGSFSKEATVTFWFKDFSGIPLKHN